LLHAAPVHSEISTAFQQLRDDWSQLSREYERLIAAPYDPQALEAHMEKLRLHRARLRFVRTSLKEQRTAPHIH
jgi:hypothetical protein